MKKYAVLATIASLVAIVFAEVLRSAFWSYQPETPNFMK